MHLVQDPGAFNAAGLSVLNLARANGWPSTVRDAGPALSSDLLDIGRTQGLSVLSPAPGPAVTASLPRIVLYVGPAIGYPYWGYYAHALLSVGLPFRCAGPEDILAGALDTADLFVMPGGFATWGLDRAEGVAGIDARVRRFLADGGGYIGSCGGAFYAAEGRPGWLGAFDTVPRYTQEYLLTGAGLISIALEDTPLTAGLPPAIEMPYYHGPAFDDPRRANCVAARFRSFITPSPLFIDNPLDHERFEVLKDRPAVLMRYDYEGDGRLVVFSPHPEMGEHVRRGVLLEGYVRHFLPIRGTQVIEQTLDFLERDAGAGFRLIHNAAHWTCPAGARGPRPAPLPDTLPTEALRDTIQLGMRRLWDSVQAESGAMQIIGARLHDWLDREWATLEPRLDQLSAGPATADLPSVLTRTVAEAANWWDGPGAGDISLGETSVMAETLIRITSAALRCLEIDTEIREVPLG